MSILVLDNYDSFVYNLVQYLGQLGVDCQVRRNDQISLAEIGRMRPAGVLLSPGPGVPDRAGIMIALIQAYRGEIPIFGVCLGHQAIAAAYGATVTRAPELLHGKTSLVSHDGAGVLAGLPHPFTATRYHSLAVVESTLPAELAVTARTLDSGIIMAIKHRTLALEGVQFHPESVLTQGGHLMLANWLAGCGHPGLTERAIELGEAVEAHRLAAFGHASA